jgi:hypothetical protein
MHLSLVSRLVSRNFVGIPRFPRTRLYPCPAGCGFHPPLERARCCAPVSGGLLFYRDASTGTGKGGIEAAARVLP